MVRTILILVFTLVILPVFAFYFDEPLTALQSNVLLHLVGAMLFFALLCFMVGEITKNNSQVDKLWSIIPIGYVWYIAYGSEWNSRIVLMAVLTTIWGARLTYNFHRRGGYHLKFWTGEEDYRWEILRQSDTFKNRKWAWTLFNLFFISLYQMSLILLFCLPALVAMQGSNTLHISDYVLAAIFITLVIIEFISDQQQWNFQTEKHRLINNKQPLPEPFSQGFTSTGLWKYSRHPNYTAEQSIWVVFYLFSVVATDRWLNWSIAGCMLLLVLFKSSSDFSEKISMEKYPLYREYQKMTSRFWPWKVLFKTRKG